MNYFRRALLAGQNLPIQNGPAVRGNVRRHDADLSSATPYFPGLSAGQTLDVSSHAGSALVALSGSSLPTVLSELNLGLSSIGVVAYDDDGCLGLRTLAVGGTAYVRVNGGTGAVALGFDTQAQNFVSYGGSTPSTAEGRRGVWFGTKFPNRGENQSVESFNRALAAVAGNSDVLYSEFMRTEAEIQKVATIQASTSSSISAADLSAAQEVFLGGLPANATALDLAKFFFITNSDGSLSHCKVTGVVDNGGQNLLGQPPQVLLLNRAITAIPNSSTVYVSTFDFPGAGVTTACYAQISGGGTVPSSNNGYWAIEEVQTHHLKLRPLSRSEAAWLGVAAPQPGVPPVLELNHQSSPLGSLTITRGPWVTGVRLLFTPALPYGASFSVWASVPVRRRERSLTKGSSPQLSAALSAIAQPTFDCLLTLPSVTVVAATPPLIAVGMFAARWNGRRIDFPAATIPKTVGATDYVYWNTALCTIVTQTATSTASSMIPIASVAANNVVTMLGRLEGGGSRTVTVGAAGSDSQFSTLSDALAYARHLYSSGHVLRPAIQISTGTMLMPTSLPIDFPVSIRGVGRTTLSRTGGASFVVSAGIQFDLRDVYTSDTLPLVTGDLSNVTMFNVRQDSNTQVSYSLGHSLLVREATTSALLDTPSSYTLLLGETSGAIQLGRSGGQVTSLSELRMGAGAAIDASASLVIGSASATSVQIGRASVPLSLSASALSLTGDTTVTGDLAVTGGMLSVGAQSGAGSCSWMEFTGLQTSWIGGWRGAFLRTTAGDASFVVAGNKTASNSNTGADVILMSQNVRTAGRVLSVMNSTSAELLAVLASGKVQVSVSSTSTDDARSLTTKDYVEGWATGSSLLSAGAQANWTFNSGRMTKAANGLVTLKLILTPTTGAGLSALILPAGWRPAGSSAQDAVIALANQDNVALQAAIHTSGSILVTGANTTSGAGVAIYAVFQQGN